MNQKSMQTAGPGNQDYYRLIPRDGTPDLYFSIPKIERLLQAEPLLFRMLQIPLTEELYGYLTHVCGILDSVVAKITPERAEQPGLALLWGEENQNFHIVDGSHRAVWRFRHGLPSFSAHAVPLEIARKRCLLDLPSGYD